MKRTLRPMVKKLTHARNHESSYPIPASKLPKFKAGKILKEALN